MISKSGKKGPLLILSALIVSLLMMGAVMLPTHKSIEVIDPVANFSNVETIPTMLLECGQNDQIFASANGIVNEADADGSMMIQYDNGLDILYFNLADTDLVAGDRVVAGNVIAHANTEIYLQTRFNGEFVNPSELFAQPLTQDSAVSILE